jgi:hypothetical protein
MAPDDWVCEHYQRRDFGSDDLDVFMHLGVCYGSNYWFTEASASPQPSTATTKEA